MDKEGKKIEGTEKSGQPDCECTFPSFAVFSILQFVLIDGSVNERVNE